jgi:hypothetical protein
MAKLMPQTGASVTTLNFPFRIMLIADQLQSNGKNICNWMSLDAKGRADKAVRVMQLFPV